MLSDTNILNSFFYSLFTLIWFIGHAHCCLKRHWNAASRTELVKGWIGGPLEQVMLEQPARWMGGCARVQVQIALLSPNIFLVGNPRRTKQSLFCQILCGIKARGSLPSWWSEGLRRGLGTWAPFATASRVVLREAKPGSCSSHLQPCTPGAWQELPWPGAVPGAHHGSLTLPGCSALPGSPWGCAWPRRTLVRHKWEQESLLFFMAGQPAASAWVKTQLSSWETKESGCRI